MSTNYEIYLEYPGKFYPSRDTLLENMAKLLKGRSGSSGYFFADDTRDISFVFKNEESVSKFYRAIKKKKLATVLRIEIEF